MNQGLDSIQRYSDELSHEVKSEIGKTGQILGFLGVLIFVGMGKLGAYSIEHKIVIAFLFFTSLGLLGYNLLGKGFLGHPPVRKIENTLSLDELKTNYGMALMIFREKVLVNKIALFLVIILFVYIATLLIFFS